MTMVGDSEFGMSFDDLCRLMSESMRALKHNGGLFLIETTHIERYVSALQQVVQENRSAFNFDIGMRLALIKEPGVKPQAVLGPDDLERFVEPLKHYADFVSSMNMWRVCSKR